LNKVYFPGLNGLRFFAAIAVVITHVEMTKKYLSHGEGLWIKVDKIVGSAFSSILSGEIRWQAPFVSAAGPLGVVFFFVLSGFLITFLLLEEKKSSGTIAIKKFYARRILRIWPLYFLIFLLGFFVLPYIPWFQIDTQESFMMNHYKVNLICYLLFIPNLAFAIYNQSLPNVGQSWSIGVEEQFYLIWPLLMKITKNLLRTMLVFILVLLAIKFALQAIPDSQHFSIGILKRFLSMSKIESMAMGGIGAYYLYNHHEKVLKWVFDWKAQWLAYLSIPAVILFTPVSLYSITYLWNSLAFLVIIMNVSSNPKSIIKLENRAFNFLGKISYGIYMYHLICITFTVYLVDYVFHFEHRQISFAYTLLIYAVSILLTISVSHLSYTYFERIFTTRKKKFTTVISGDDARA
jgi:peptidoglycan/LPS O-acetylase OafA/YrhL